MKLGYVVKNVIKFEKYENMGKYGKIWKNHEKSWKTQKIYRKIEKSENSCFSVPTPLKEAVIQVQND